MSNLQFTRFDGHSHKLEVARSVVVEDDSSTVGRCQGCLELKDRIGRQTLPKVDQADAQISLRCAVVTLVDGRPIAAFFHEEVGEAIREVFRLL